MKTRFTFLVNESHDIILLRKAIREWILPISGNAIGGSLEETLFSFRQTAESNYMAGVISDSPVSGHKTDGNTEPAISGC